MIADVEPLAGLRRFPSLPLGASWERHTLGLQANNTFPKQTIGQQDLMSFAEEAPSSSGVLTLALHCRLIIMLLLLTVHQSTSSKSSCNLLSDHHQLLAVKLARAADRALRYASDHICSRYHSQEVKCLCGFLLHVCYR